MMWNQTNAQCPSQELHATNAGENNEFGWPVAIDGDYLVIGSGLEGENSNRTGAAYVFQKIKDMWVEIKKLTASDGANADNFGTAVAINDETIIVGARSHDPAGIDSAGAAYVFERNYGGVNNWGQAKKLVASSQSDDAFFGFAVDIHDDTIVVGATRAFSGDGAAFAFDRNFGGDENWGETAVLFSTGREHGYRTDDVGRKVSVYGNIIIVSELYMPDNSTITGAVTVFRRVNEPAGWIEIKRLTAEPFQDDDDYAKTIDIVEETIIVGSAGRDDRGTVFMYKRNLGGVDAWGEYGTIYPSDGEITDAFGRVVSLGTDRIMVQAPSDQNNEGPDGSAYIFRRDFDSGNEQWNESVKLLFNDAAEGESWSIKGAMSSNSIVFGNPVDDDFGYNSGSAYVYRLNYVEVLPTIIER